MQVRNAIITEAFLGKKGDALIAVLALDYGGGVTQNFGGFPLSSGMAELFVSDVLTAAGVQSWSNLIGRAVRVEQDEKQVYRIGHIVRDVWFNPVRAAQILNDLEIAKTVAPILLLQRVNESRRVVDAMDDVLLADIRRFLNEAAADAE